MKCFEHNGDKCISINGKDYFLLRGYMSDHSKFIFVQVAGNTPLHKEDMPTKDWEIITTKASSQKVWTAYKKAYFKYDAENDSMELAFLGMTAQGSYFLALKWLARKFNKNISEEKLHLLAGQLVSSESYQKNFKKCSDQGASGEDAVIFNFGYSFDEENAIKILKGETI